MKTNKILAILACATLALTSCQEEDLWGGNKYAPAKPGDEIIFGGTVQYKTTRVDATRTVYGDKGTSGTEIKWYEGDMVRIYCAEATLGEGETDQKYCDYTVTNYIEKPVYENGTLTNPDTSNPKGDGYTSTHSSGLVTADGNPGLRWGTGTHTFYGVYPTAGQLSAAGDNVAANALKLTSSTLEAYLPNTQEPARYVAATTFAGENYDGTTNNNAKHYTIHPAMRNAYMVAKQTAKPEDGSVTLTFNPVVAAVEMTLINNSTHTEGNTTTGVPLADISLINLTASSPICGYFKAGYNTDGNITCENVSTDQSYYTVGVPVEDENGEHITLNYGDKITFTVFMTLPEDLSSISVSIVAGGVTKSATINGSNGVKIIQAQKKNFIANVPIALSTVKEVSLENWMASYPDSYEDADGKTVTNYISGLSIPGAGGATSYAFDATYITNNSISDELVAASQEQTLDINGLWERGIRCFEFMVDNASSFGSQYVYCNGIKTTTTLKTAVDAVAAKIANTKDANGKPTEFGVVIITYQEENYTSYDRNAGNDGFAEYFGTWWNAYSYTGVTKKLYSSSLALADARGCLFCIGRPVAAGLDAGWYTGVADGDNNSTVNNFSDGTVLNILGWGNNADQWYARGFGTLDNDGPSSSDTWSATNPSAGVMNRPFHVGQTSLDAAKPATSYVHKDKSNFTYKVSNQADQSWSAMTSTGWIQEWRRVVPSEATRTQYGITALPSTTTNGGDGTGYYYYWEPSEDEKWDDIVDALNKSINSTGGHAIYLNSLCGYFVDGSISMSYLPRLTYQRLYFNPSSWLVGNDIRFCMDDKYMRDEDDTDVFGAFMNNTSSLTSKDKPTVSDWGPYHAAGGFRGNIAAYADWVNNKFYNLLLTMLANGTLNGPTGIVMMDRVSDTADDPAGYYIPQIIISNNFSSSATSDVSITYSDTPFDASSDTPAAPARR